jgi:uncharacterized protein (DUF2147 family)
MSTIISRLAKAIIAATAIVSTHPGPAAAADLTGTWLTEDTRARVRTERCGSRDAQLCGYLVWARDPRDGKGQPRVDSENPDPLKRKRPILGHQMILGLKLNDEGRFTGKIYNADNGKFYNITVWSEKPDELSLQGCMMAVLCGTQTWKRVTNVLPGQLQGPADVPGGGPRADREWASNRTPATETILPQKAPPGAARAAKR